MRTDLAIVPNPSGPYPWTAANIVAPDPDFGQRILRVTDPTTTGKPMQTASAGAANLFNLDSTMLLSDSVGGLKYLFQFDPKNFQAHLLPYTFKGVVTFSRIVPGRIYQILGTQLSVINFVNMSGTWVLSNTKPLFNFATILPTGFVPVWTSFFACSADDNAFSIAFSTGIQGTGHLVCNWHRPIGPSLLDTSSTIFPPFLVHDIYQTPNNDVVFVTGNDSSTKAAVRLLWNPSDGALMNVPLSGHDLQANTYIAAGGKGGGQWTSMLYSDTSIQHDLIPVLPSPPLTNDKHASFNASAGDNSPFAVSVLNSGPVTTAWAGEITLVDPTTGIVSRACHHLALETNPLFDVANAIPSISQDGRFVAFCSDLMGTITGDLFVVELT